MTSDRRERGELALTHFVVIGAAFAFSFSAILDVGFILVDRVVDGRMPKRAATLLVVMLAARVLFAVSAFALSRWLYGRFGTKGSR